MTTNSLSAAIFATIESIAGTAAKTEKVSIMKGVDSGLTPLFLRVLTAAYDPFTTYGIALVPLRSEGATGAGTLDDEAPWVVLKMLASRQLSGNAAREAVASTIESLTAESAELFRRILLGDMRAGFTDNTINKVFPGTIAEFPYMRCSLPKKSNMDKWDWSVGIISQEKADGMFSNVNLDGDSNLTITSRQGSRLPLDALGALPDVIRRTLKAGTQSHGELLVYQDGKLLAREVGNGVMNSIIGDGHGLAENQHIEFHVWDQIPLSEVKPKGKYNVPYKQRLLGLMTQIKAAGPVSQVKLIDTRIVKSKAEAWGHYRGLLKLGKEGTIEKHPEAFWKDGTSLDQVKLKLEFEVDLRIKGYVEGTPGTKTAATFGSVLCETCDGKLEVAVSGFTDARRLAIHNDREHFKGKIMTVRANAIMAATEPGELFSLFLPRHVEIREDKVMADTLEQVYAQYDAAIAAA